MNSTIRSPSDFWSGLIYMAVGIFVVVASQDYGLGTAVKMGPGYFPTVLGGLLAIIGLLSLLRSFRHSNGHEVIRINLRSVFLIAAPIVLFAAIVRGAGVLIALPVLIFGSAYASAQFSFKRTLLLAIGLTAGCSLVFMKGLGIPMPLIGSWFGG
ncbi:MAG TPA: tripartite tricarboxylate transporter TctB family protein [Rhodocyclaceae bacterium]|nr:tripartite tricarboxylate transporter TctB family protein [Rhodocyclaceae bacterium]